jgi:hypothetical protein
MGFHGAAIAGALIISGIGAMLASLGMRSVHPMHVPPRNEPNKGNVVGPVLTHKDTYAAGIAHNGNWGLPLHDPKENGISYEDQLLILVADNGLANEIGKKAWGLLWAIRIYFARIHEQPKFRWLSTALAHARSHGRLGAALQSQLDEARKIHGIYSAIVGPKLAKGLWIGLGIDLVWQMLTALGLIPIPEVSPWLIYAVQGALAFISAYTGFRMARSEADDAASKEHLIYNYMAREKSEELSIRRYDRNTQKLINVPLEALLAKLARRQIDIPEELPKAILSRDDRKKLKKLETISLAEDKDLGSELATLSGHYDSVHQLINVWVNNPKKMQWDIWHTFSLEKSVRKPYSTAHELLENIHAQMLLQEIVARNYPRLASAVLTNGSPEGELNSKTALTIELPIMSARVTLPDVKTMNELAHKLKKVLPSYLYNGIYDQRGLPKKDVNIQQWQDNQWIKLDQTARFEGLHQRLRIESVITGGNNGPVKTIGSKTMKPRRGRFKASAQNVDEAPPAPADIAAQAIPDDKASASPEISVREFLSRGAKWVNQFLGLKTSGDHRKGGNKLNVSA